MFDNDDVTGLPRRAERSPGPHAAATPDAEGQAAPARPARRRALAAAALIVVAAALLYYPIGMAMVHRINDDPEFAPTGARAEAGGSRTVALTAALIAREIDGAGWVPNDPAIYPSAALDNMPNFQLGLKAALFRFAIELTDQIGRTRGSSQADGDLDSAAGELKFPGDVWLWDMSVSVLPTATSENHYRKAVRLLDLYNQRLGEGNAVFDRRADNLLGTLDRIAADLGSASAELESHVRGQAGGLGGGLLDFAADDLFYNVKGRLYGYYMILAALGTDFDQVMAERQLGPAWAQMLTSMRTAAVIDPLLVVNGAPDGMMASHLVVQGFYLLRARTQLREISNILLK
ncbi:MAG: DUF2333 family protein [Alphaproteobacteria bacterium]|nr:DUF2333 family protein [Alphaproteobacteria bacterium]MDP6515869.1 DUF2333 family protein [Alphaproteobacteria bacterium]